LWTKWRDVLIVVRPETVIRWHRLGFKLFWRWTSRSGRRRSERKSTSVEVRALIRKMAIANPLWGAPRVHGELLKLGIDISERTVSRLMPRERKPPSQTWRTFLENHAASLVSTDFFVVPTATFRVLFVLVVLAHERRRVVHFNITSHPTAEWTARQITEAFPFDTTPRYLLRDRDSIFGAAFRSRVRRRGIEEVLTAPRSPWQNPYAERLAGSIRRDCLKHVIVVGEGHLHRILSRYFDYYHRWRTHLSLEKDTPDPRAVQPPEKGRGVEFAEVGGLHHRYERRAA
jgi:putative transposase